jgi:hypothetical protein
MNTQTQITRANIRSSIKKTRLMVVLAIVLGAHANQLLAADDVSDNYDENVLFTPSEAVLLAETKGRVTIYDSLEHRVVDQALDTQFNRIENMMFVRMRETLPDGSVEIDDDCD